MNTNDLLDDAKKIASNAWQTGKQNIYDQVKELRENDIALRKIKSEAPPNLPKNARIMLGMTSDPEQARRLIDAYKNGVDRGNIEYQKLTREQGSSTLDMSLSFGAGGLARAGGKIGKELIGEGAEYAATKGSKLFKSAAETVGSKIPSLKKVNNIFKSAAEIAEERTAALKAEREVARAKRAEEAQQKAREALQKSREAKNAANPPPQNPFKNQTERLEQNVEQATQQTAPSAAETNIFQQAASWLGSKTLNVGKSVGKGILNQGADLGKAALKGAGKAAIPSVIAGSLYKYALPEDAKKLISDNAQETVDSAIKFGSDLFENPKETLKKAFEDNQETIEDVGAAGVGAAVATGSLPGRGILSGVGSLFSGGGSISNIFNSTPSGGDSGRVGESHFGGNEVQGKSAVEILTKIYSLLSKTQDTVLDIARDTANLSKGQAQQDVAGDLLSQNMRARQNESGGGGASPIFSGGGGGGGGEDEEKDSGKEKGLLSKFFDLLGKGKNAAVSTAKKVLPAAAVLGGAAMLAAPSKLDTGSSPTFEGKKLTSKQKDNYDRIIIEAQKQGLSQEQTDGLLALAWHESHFNDDARGILMKSGMHEGDRAHGTFQYMAKSSKGWNRDDPAQNIAHGVADFKKHSEQFGGNLGAFAAHHAGSGVVNPDGTLKRDVSDGHEYTSQYQKRINNIAESLKSQREASGKKTDTSGEKPTINGKQLTGDTSRNPYFGKETSEFDVPAPEGENKVQEERLPYVLSDKGDGKFAKINIWTRKKTTATPDEIKKFQEQTDRDNGKATATPVAYNNVPDSEKLDAPKFMIRESYGNKWKVDLETGEETLATDDDIKQDNEQKQKEKQWTEKHKEATATPVSGGTDSDGLNQDDRKELDAVDNEIKNSGLYKKMEPSKFGEPTEAGFKMVDEVSRIDKRKSELDEELTQQSLHTAYPDKESMEKDLHRLDEIYAEQDSLNNKRNDITATEEWRNAEHARSQQAQGAQSSTPPASQKQPPPPTTSSGTGKSVPSVRNDDPTIKMMEEGNMWRTNSHEA